MVKKTPNSWLYIENPSDCGIQCTSSHATRTHTRPNDDHTHKNVTVVASISTIAAVAVVAAAERTEMPISTSEAATRSRRICNLAVGPARTRGCA